MGLVRLIQFTHHQLFTGIFFLLLLSRPSAFAAIIDNNLKFGNEIYIKADSVKADSKETEVRVVTLSSNGHRILAHPTSIAEDETLDFLGVDYEVLQKALKKARKSGGNYLILSKTTAPELSLNFLLPDFPVKDVSLIVETEGPEKAWSWKHVQNTNEGVLNAFETYIKADTKAEARATRLRPLSKVQLLAKLGITSSSIRELAQSYFKNYIQDDRKSRKVEDDFSTKYKNFKKAAEVIHSIPLPPYDKMSDAFLTLYQLFLHLDVQVSPHKDMHNSSISENSKQIKDVLVKESIIKEFYYFRDVEDEDESLVNFFGGYAYFPTVDSRLNGILSKRFILDELAAEGKCIVLEQKKNYISFSISECDPTANSESFVFDWDMSAVPKNLVLFIEKKYEDRQNIGENIRVFRWDFERTLTGNIGLTIRDERYRKNLYAVDCTFYETIENYLGDVSVKSANRFLHASKSELLALAGLNADDFRALWESYSNYQQDGTRENKETFLFNLKNLAGAEFINTIHLPFGGESGSPFYKLSLIFHYFEQGLRGNPGSVFKDKNILANLTDYFIDPNP